MECGARCVLTCLSMLLQSRYPVNFWTRHWLWFGFGYYQRVIPFKFTPTITWIYLLTFFAWLAEKRLMCQLNRSIYHFTPLNLICFHNDQNDWHSAASVQLLTFLGVFELKNRSLYCIFITRVPFLLWRFLALLSTAATVWYDAIIPSSCGTALSHLMSLVLPLSFL